MKKLLSIILIAQTLTGNAQVISRFTWDSTPLTKAAVGPNGTSVNSTAYPVAVASPVNYAINPGTPTKDIDLVVPGSPTFDVAGIDIDLYFRREESEASFFKRGSLFNFGMINGQLTLTFTTNKGSNPGTTTVNWANTVTVADDHAFHHYRFKYDNNTGVANVYVDDVIVYTYNGTAGYTMNWASAGDVVIGSKMDATGRNIAVLGNMTIQLPGQAATLPLSLLSFEAAAKNNAAVLDWSTTKELNVEKFVVESSSNGAQFSAVSTVSAAGAYELVHHYQAMDNSRHESVVYYRLKMMDNDGKFTYSAIKKLNFGTSSSVSCFPNPAKDHVTLSITNASAGDFKYVVMSMTGSILQSAAVRIESGAQQIRIDLSKGLPQGTLMITLVKTKANTADTFKVIKG
jgi:hypothetical protein